MSRFAPFLLTIVAIFTASTAQADDRICLSVRFDYRKMSREECARKAVEAMGVMEKFPFAEVTKDGNAQGWNDDVAVQVLSYSMPDPDRVFIMVIAGGMDKQETERVLQSVQARVLDGRVNPDTPTKFAPANGTTPPRPITLLCKSEEQGATPVLRHFVSAATIVLEKKGYQTTPGNGVVLGFIPGRGAVTFLAPTTRATSYRFNVVYATQEEESGEAAADDLLGQMVKVLYE